MSGARAPARLVLLAAFVVAALQLPVQPLGAAVPEASGWNVTCPHSHSATDDPIVRPGEPGVTHLHDFYGATTTDAFSTHQSLRGSTTTCRLDGDTSAYWQPALLVGGRAVAPAETVNYYRAPGAVSPSEVRPFPPGLAMIAGDAKATAPQPLSVVHYTCTGSDMPKSSRPFDCGAYGEQVKAKIKFPACWDGVNLDSSDHKSHMAYPVKGACPATHPVPLPAITMNVTWPVADATGAELSSGSALTMHADFLNAWDPYALDRLMANCLRAGIVCTSDDGDGEPTIGSVLLSPTPVYATSTIRAEARNVYDPRGMGVSLHYEWRVDGVIAGADAPTLGPEAFGPGDQVVVTVRAVDGGGLWGPPTSSPVRVVEWNVSAPRAASPGGSLGGVGGGGYAPSEVVDLRLDAVAGPLLATVTADGAGSWKGASVPLPAPLPGGVHSLFGIGRSSGIVGAGPFSVVPSATLTPSALGAGDATTFAALGFRPGEPVAVSFPGEPPVSAVADAAGSVVLRLVAPPQPSEGGFVAASAPSGTAEAKFSTLTRVTLPATARPQDSVPLSATGFGAGEPVTVTFEGSSTAQTFTADARGSVAGTVVVSARFGKPAVTATGTRTGVSRQTTIHLPVWLTLTPSSGRVGTAVRVLSSYGWQPGHVVRLAWNGTKLADVVADGAGSIDARFTVPQAKIGTHNVKLTDDAASLTGSAPFTVTS